jgi:CheY-like chemotaxis protein
MHEKTNLGLPIVLLVDDDLVSREVVATLLTMSGYAVHSAEDGAASLKMIGGKSGSPAAFVPGIIMLDAQMPGLSGSELIGRYRACSKARIYVMSGSQPQPELVAAADGVILKPFTIGAFRKLVEGDKPQPAATHLEPGEPVISAEILAQYRKMMPEPKVREIYATVVSDLRRRIETLGAAISRRDAAQVRRIGHAIKGGCGMAGAVQASRLGALLESEDNQLDNSDTLLRDLRAAARQLERMLNAELPAGIFNAPGATDRVRGGL